MRRGTNSSPETGSDANDGQLVGDDSSPVGPPAIESVTSYFAVVPNNSAQHNFLSRAGDDPVAEFRGLSPSTTFSAGGSFAVAGRLDAAPFSLGQAVSQNTSPLPEPYFVISKAQQAGLISAYLRETGTWCETTDSNSHFTVKSMHQMMESKPFMAAAMSLASRQLDNIRRNGRKITLELYQYTIQLLLRHDPAEVDAAILATCTLLCVYEMMASNVSEWRRHLKVSICSMNRHACNKAKVVAGLRWPAKVSKMGR